MAEIYVTADDHDYFISGEVTDSISMLRFFPSSDKQILAGCGWDSKLYAWDINYTKSVPSRLNVKSQLFYIDQFDNPLLSIAWRGFSSNIFSGSVDGSIYMTDIQKREKYFLGKHELGCRDLIYLDQMNILISGGWDRKINVWDLRSNEPVISSSVCGKVYSMSCARNLFVVALSGQNLLYYDLRKFQMSGQLNPDVSCKSPLKNQTTKVCCFPKGDGFGLASIEGRVSIKYVDLNQPINFENGVSKTREDFNFRCHRNELGPSKTAEIYAVNDIAFSPISTSFITVGSNGVYDIWDKQAKVRLREAKLRSKCPITACAYSLNGELMAYGEGYDWSKGVNGLGNLQVRVGIKYITESEKGTIK